MIRPAARKGLIDIFVAFAILGLSIGIMISVLMLDAGQLELANNFNEDVEKVSKNEIGFNVFLKLKNDFYVTDTSYLRNVISMYNKTHDPILESDIESSFDEIFFDGKTGLKIVDSVFGPTGISFHYDTSFRKIPIAGGKSQKIVLRRYD